RQQDAAFLEGLADRGDAEGELLLVEPLAARIERRVSRDLAVTLVDAAAGKYQGARIELDLDVAHHHEDFDLARHSVPQQQDSRGIAGGDNFIHQSNSLPLTLVMAGLVPA